jgi:hypothetical protein
MQLVCPRDRSPLRDGVCEQGHEYPLVDGSPILLVAEEAPTHAACARVEELPPPTADGIDPFVREVIGATCGRLYDRLGAELHEYPIPKLRLPPGDGRTFLEIGGAATGLSASIRR